MGQGRLTDCTDPSSISQLQSVLEMDMLLFAEQILVKIELHWNCWNRGPEKNTPTAIFVFVCPYILLFWCWFLFLLLCVSLAGYPTECLTHLSSVLHFLTLNKFFFADQLFLLVSFLIPFCKGIFVLLHSDFSPLLCVSRVGWGCKFIGIFCNFEAKLLLLSRF